ncbi:MAG: glycosyltransferase [Aquisalinus sp.]|nr:glycosyltransferase [Aquisalinus sp.]
MKKVSIIIPHFNQPDLLEKCLEALACQSYAGPIETIVCDNNTPGGIDHIRRKFPAVFFLCEREKGAACARNAALRIAQGDIIAFTDSDCVPDIHWIANGVQGLQSTGADMIGGKVTVVANQPEQPTAVEAFEMIFGFRQRLYVEKKNFSVTANLFVQKDVIRRTGPFVNGLSEDVDWCHRAAALGFHLSFYRKCIVSHPARRNWTDLKNKWLRLITEQRNGYQVAWGGGIAGGLRWYLLALVTAGSALPHAALTLCSPAAGKLRSRVGATGVLFRIRFWRCATMLRLGFGVRDKLPLSDGKNCTEYSFVQEASE